MFIIYGKAIARAHTDHLNEWELDGQAANITFESACIGWHKPDFQSIVTCNISQPLWLILSHEGWKAESTYPQ